MKNKAKNNDEKTNVKKKKKHRFLKLIIIIIIITAITKVYNYYCDKKAEFKLQQVTSYPIVSFVDESNSKAYITNDFIINDYSDLGLKWSVNTDNVVLENNNDGTITVHVKQPEDKSIPFTLTLTSTYGGREAVQKTDMMIACLNHQNPEDFDIVTIDEVADGSYRKDMTIKLDKTDNVFCMYGDFDDIYINNIEDGYALIEAYRDELNIQENVEFKNVDVRDILDETLYWYVGTFNGLYIGNYDLKITVNEKNELTEISTPFSRIEFSENDLQFFVDADECLEKYLKENFSAYKYEKLDKAIGLNEKGAYIYQTYNVDTNIESYDAVVNGKTGEVSLYNRTYSYADAEESLNEQKFSDSYIASLNETIPAQCAGNNEKGKKLKFTASELDGKYMLYNKRNNIVCCKNNSELFLYHISEAINEHNSLSDKLLLQSKNSRTISEYPSPDFPDSMTEESQLFTNVSNANDWYETKFGLNSYDDNGSRLVLVANMKTDNDNAYWDSNFQEIRSCPSNIRTTCVSISPVVCTHEYTHAVSNEAQKRNGRKNINQNIEYNAINEACADIMAYFCLGNDKWNADKWKMTGNNNGK